jgi:hypothetical protein
MTNDGAFGDLNNHEIADQISAFLAEKNLEGKKNHMSEIDVMADAGPGARLSAQPVWPGL